MDGYGGHWRISALYTGFSDAAVARNYSEERISAATNDISDIGIRWSDRSDVFEANVWRPLHIAED